MQLNLSSIFSAAAVFFFVYAVVVQLNDVDPVLWTVLYGGAAILVVTKNRFPLALWQYGGLAAITAIWGIALGTVSTASMGIVAIEERREMGGLFIVAGVMVWLLMQTRRKDESQKSTRDKGEYNGV